MQYKVELRQNNETIISKEFEEYDNAYDYSNELISQIENNIFVVLLELKNDKWVLIRKLSLEN
ncbi:hypothetical protein [uncultured Cetobacterium sp.]|uniref:hypothetical protein n=1 Tax=uncultured Cetobacterium sp. TaxID=527638 RepID=UPI002628565C|nr:hypothetical protein [uncultured Cetobacterium sp.]